MIYGKLRRLAAKAQGNTVGGIVADARDMGLRLRQVSSGLNRMVWEIRGHGIVLKIDESGGQSHTELKAIKRLRRFPRLRKFLPKVYFYGCHVPFDGVALVAMRYYPSRITARQIHRLQAAFRRTIVSDVHSSNMRQTKSGQPKLIDLGI